MEHIAAESAPDDQRPIAIAAHSLGTVVMLRVLLDAIDRDLPWARRVTTLATFGSPLDLFVILFPELLTIPARTSHRSIRWTNYCFFNDPIASDLAVCRSWLKTNRITIFDDRAPEEIELGAGSLLAAHTDYWRDATMVRHIIEGHARVESDPDARPRRKWRRPHINRVFLFASVATSALAAWLLLVWWEQNTKISDADRLVLLDDPAWQAAMWVLSGLMIWFFCPGLEPRLARGRSKCTWMLGDRDRSRANVDAGAPGDTVLLASRTVDDLHSGRRPHGKRCSLRRSRNCRDRRCVLRPEVPFETSTDPNNEWARCGLGLLGTVRRNEKQSGQSQ